MIFTDLHPDIQTTATTALTQKQLDVWKLELAGCNPSETARILNVSRTTIRDHLDNITRNLTRAGIRQSVTGTYYLRSAA